MNRAQKAKELYDNGYACSQAVALAFADLVTLSEDEIKKIMLPFGGGMGRLRLVCGAVSGMSAILGLIISKVEVNHQNKMDTYAVTRELCDQFKQASGSLICSDLIAASRGEGSTQNTATVIKKLPCDELVYTAATILDNYLKEHNLA